MPKVDTNTVSLAYARETGTPDAKTGIKPLPNTHVAGTYRALEPNDIGSFGATIATTAREPISNRLQRQKGTITDLDGAAGFPADLTMDGFLDWIEAVMFAWRSNEDVWRRAVSASSPTDGSESITFASIKRNDVYRGSVLSGATDADAPRDAQIAKLDVATGAASLVWLTGMGQGANNGLKVVRTAATDASPSVLGLADYDRNGDGTATAAIVAGDESAPAGARMSLAGVQLTMDGTQNNRGWRLSGSAGVLTMTTAQYGLVSKLLSVGQIVHFGSIPYANGDLRHGLHTAVAVGTVGDTGYARVRALDPGNTGAYREITFDRLDAAIKKNINLASNRVVHIMIGDFLQNVATDDDLYAEITHAIELASDDLLGTTSAPKPGYEYARGCQISSLALSFPLNDKATFSAEFIARDVDEAVEKDEGTDSGDRTAPTKPVLTAAFNTTADFARLRVMDHDEEGLDTDFTSVTLTINPQLAAEKVLGRLGAKYINRGNMLVDVEAEAIFASKVVSDAVRKNTTMFFDMIVGNDEGVLAFDVPSMTLGGGDRSYPTNEAVKISATGNSFEDALFKSSLMVSMFAVPLPTE